MSPHRALQHRPRARRALPIALAACGVLLAAACGADHTDAGDPTPPPTSASPAPSSTTDVTAAPASFPVTITHALGDTVIPTAPSRVVALGATDQDPLLALGVVPVAATNWQGSATHPWNEALLAGEDPVEIADIASGIEYEAIAATDPDLIVALWADLSAEQYEQLSSIAPTIAHSADHEAYGAPWDANLRTLGAALGRGAEAEAVIAGTTAQITAAKAAHPELAGKSVVIAADFADGQIYITTPTDSRYQLLADLGMDTAPASLAGVEAISPEQVDRLNGIDAVIWITLPDATIATNDYYLAQPVHTEGHDIFPAAESELSLALTFGTSLSIPYTIDHLVPLLAAAVDGDPATTAG